MRNMGWGHVTRRPALFHACAIAGNAFAVRYIHGGIVDEEEPVRYATGTAPLEGRTPAPDLLEVRTGALPNPDTTAIHFLARSVVEWGHEIIAERFVR